MSGGVLDREHAPPEGNALGGPDPGAPGGRTLGQRLRDAREALGLTLEALEELTDLTGPYISRIERDLAVPSTQALEAIATALRLPDDEIPSLMDQREAMSIEDRLDVDSVTANAIVALTQLDDAATVREMARVSRMLRKLDADRRDELVHELREVRQAAEESDPQPISAESANE